MLNKKPLSLAACLATALLLTGCATNQPLPVEKVVLDWKDFEPVQFSPSDDCNTVQNQGSNYVSMKQLCFADRSSLGDDRYFLKFTEYHYSAKQWAGWPTKLVNNRSSIPDYLRQSSSTVCKGNYQAVGQYGYTCTPLDDSTNEDILLIHNYRKKGKHRLIESLVVKSIPRNQKIETHDSQYQTALRIINDSFDKL